MNNYVIVKRTFGEVQTEVYFASSLREAESRKIELTLSAAAFDNDTTAEYFIAEVLNEPISTFERKLFQFVDWLRNFGS